LTNFHFGITYRLTLSNPKIAVYLVMYSMFHFVGPKTTGILSFLLLGTTGIITRFMPSIMMGVYVVSTTTVSEFTAAMLRMHISEKLIIPSAPMLGAQAKARFLFPRFLCVFQAPCRGFHYDIVLFVQPVKLRVKLAAARGFFAFFFWKKELVYRDVKKRYNVMNT